MAHRPDRFGAGAPRQDIADTVFLAELLGLSTTDEIVAVHDRYFADEPLTDADRSRLDAVAQILADGPDAAEGLGDIITRARSRRTPDERD